MSEPSDPIREDFRGIHVSLQDAARAGSVCRGLHAAITSGTLPPGTPLTYADIQAGYKTGNAQVAVAFRALTRLGLVDTPTSTGTYVLGPAQPEPAREQGRETQGSYVKRIVRHRIDTGFYAPGNRIPPYRELARSFQVSPTQIQRSLQALIDDGTLTQTPPGLVVTDRTPARGH
ncbi:GntR family transcriptional regulator [Streptomyces acidiscabies]|uniref:GntR family transcriptional regulator n=1 Tax=Streptomyces acidiscabies TaxID=42234 RepID=A0ABU4MA32_9ACTN|nr:GntR family transcriptional regulator [Streptomyces acidiscabies]MDX3024950.1 GntR family transcriptional regulator [Streptomyces acidiscabies]